MRREKQTDIRFSDENEQKFAKRLTIPTFRNIIEEKGTADDSVNLMLLYNRMRKKSIVFPKRRKGDDMKRTIRSRAAALLKQYPFLHSALRNLNAQIAAEEHLYRRMTMRGTGKRAEADREEKMCTIEDMYAKRWVMECKLMAIKRTLAAMPGEDRGLLLAFYAEGYTRDTPFLLMERYGYEKSTLYAKRGKALDRFVECYGVDMLMDVEV